MRPQREVWRCWVLAMVFALVFLVACSIRLGVQGLCYDELHQATAAFAYVGEAPTLFMNQTILGIPILNMTYSGALKSAAYGLVLQFTGGEFSIISWRLLGILFVFAGLVVLGSWMIRKTHWAYFALFVALMTTDLTVLLSTRHDWGPSALALGLRLVLLRIWLAGELQETPTWKNTFWCCAIVGLLLFEKLSAIGLIVPLVVMLAANPKRRTRPHLLAGITGMGIGSAGLAIVNIVSLIQDNTLISLQDIGGGGAKASLYNLVGNYITLGSGTRMQGDILGIWNYTIRYFELATTPVLIFGGVVLAVILYRKAPEFRIAFLSFVAYFLVPAGLLCLPRSTSTHHWIIGTPFQYVGLCVLLIGLVKYHHLLLPWMKWVCRGMLVLGMILAGTRLTSFVLSEKALFEGRCSDRWSPELSDLGRFARSKLDEAVFIASDWGVATQIQCFANGRPIVKEVFWEDSKSGDALQFAEASGKHAFYVVYRRQDSKYNRTNTVLSEIRQSTRWVEAPIESEVGAWRVVGIQKFRRF